MLSVPPSNLPGPHSSGLWCPKLHALLCLLPSPFPLHKCMMPVVQYCRHQNPWGLLRHSPQSPQPHSFRFQRSREQQRICMSAKFLGDAAAGHRPVFECPCPTLRAGLLSPHLPWCVDKREQSF